MDTSELGASRLLKHSPGYPEKRYEIVGSILRADITASHTPLATPSEVVGLHVEDRYWPDYATRSDSIESLIEAFAGLGFQQCQDSSLESGYEKVALYEKQGVWKHAALQTPTGRWRSKMGEGPLIEHLSLESLSDGMYGNPTIYMRRSASET